MQPLTTGINMRRTGIILCVSILCYGPGDGSLVIACCVTHFIVHPLIANLRLIYVVREMFTLFTCSHVQMFTSPIFKFSNFQIFKLKKEVYHKKQQHAYNHQQHITSNLPTLYPSYLPTPVL